MSDEKGKGAASGEGSLSEEQLLKNLATMEGEEEEELDEDGKKKEKKVPAEKSVATARLSKSASEVIRERGSGDLRKALDVSGVLNEVVALMGAHTDEALETLQKSINASAQRDLKVITVLEKLHKSVGDLAERLENFGKAPAGKPAAERSAGKVEVIPLRKSAGGADGGGEQTPVTRQQVISTLERLAKNAQGPDRDQLIRSTIKFESSGQISNADLVMVQEELKKSVRAA